MRYPIAISTNKLIAICILAALDFMFATCTPERIPAGYDEQRYVDSEDVEVKSPFTLEAVDLGLSVMWANANIGANAEEDYGDYYAWGETETKSTYSWQTYIWCEEPFYEITKYCTLSHYGIIDNKFELEPEDDVAHVKLGGKWRMPTPIEFEELETNCKIIGTVQNGVNGIRFTGKNGNSIFFPAAGYIEGEKLVYDNKCGRYWTSYIRDESPNSGVAIDFRYIVDWNIHHRCYGFTVRPVEVREDAGDNANAKNIDKL